MFREEIYIPFQNLNPNYLLQEMVVYFRSNDNGETWEEMYSDNSIVFFDVKFCNNKVDYAVARGKENDFLNKKALLYKSEDEAKLIQLFKEPERPCTVRLNGIREGCIDCLDEKSTFMGVGDIAFYSVTGGRANRRQGLNYLVFSRLSQA